MRLERGEILLDLLIKERALRAVAFIEKRTNGRAWPESLWRRRSKHARE
jgi:hypothetical protein